MYLKIISLKGIEFEGGVVSVNLMTTSGEITVLDKHRPLITSLAPGKAHIIKENGDKLDFGISSGFLEVSANNHVTIMAG